MSDTMVKEKGKKLVLDDYLDIMTDAYNAKLFDIHRDKEKAGKIVGEFQKIKKESIRQMAIELMTADLSNTQKGHTLEEMGAHLFVHFGKVKSGFTFDSYVEPTDKTREQIRLEEHKKRTEEAKSKEEWTKKKNDEMKIFTSIAEDFVTSGRSYKTDPLGFKVGLGDDIQIDKNKHYRMI
jgi:hypothetical protein